MEYSDYHKQLTRALKYNRGYSVRRYFIDLFLFRIFSQIKADKWIIDMGGKKEKSRGFFSLAPYNHHVHYANIDKETNPDFLCDIADLPVNANSYDMALLCEVIEHLKNPTEVLKEAHRVLKPGGQLIITAPFLYHVHADPFDYARYTAYWFDQQLNDLGFSTVSIEKQGLFFSILANMVKMTVANYKTSRLTWFSLVLRLVKRINPFLIKRLMALDRKTFIRHNQFFAAHTTGYAIIATKN